MNPQNLSHHIVLFTVYALCSVGGELPEHDPYPGLVRHPPQLHRRGPIPPR